MTQTRHMDAPLLVLVSPGQDDFVRAALEAVLQVRRKMSGIHSFHVSRMEVHSDRPLEAALDGEVCGRLPATFAVAGEALDIVTPVEFRDVDDV